MASHSRLWDKFRNWVSPNILLLNWTNVNYRKQKSGGFSSSPLFWSFLQKFQLDLQWRHAQDFRTIFGIQIGSILLREIQQTYFTQCTGYTIGRSLGEKAIAEYYDTYSTVFNSYDIHTPRHLPDTFRHHPDTFQTPIYTIQTPPDIGIFNTPEGIGRKWQHLNIMT